MSYDGPITYFGLHTRHATTWVIRGWESLTDQEPKVTTTRHQFLPDEALMQAQAQLGKLYPSVEVWTVEPGTSGRRGRPIWIEPGEPSADDYAPD